MNRDEMRKDLEKFINKVCQQITFNENIAFRHLAANVIIPEIRGILDREQKLTQENEALQSQVSSLASENERLKNPTKPKPTIAELEAILNDPSKKKVVMNPDGSITVEDDPNELKQQIAELGEELKKYKTFVKRLEDVYLPQIERLEEREKECKQQITEKDKRILELEEEKQELIAQVNHYLDCMADNELQLDKINVDNLEKIMCERGVESGQEQIKEVNKKGLWSADLVTITFKDLAQAICKEIKGE